MPSSPFADDFAEDKFYTQSSDNHHHRERANFRVPGDWLHFASVVANSPLAPEYETISDIMRDGFAKAIRVALDRVNDPEAVARFTIQLANEELARANAQDKAEVDNADNWGQRLAIGHGYNPANFRRDMALMKNPDAIRLMEHHASRYSL